MKSITTYPSLLAFLDSLVSSVPWDDFYTSRRYPAPFILQNESPDENLVAFLTENKTISSALELGCGEGRNAIYMAKQGLSVTALDISQPAVDAAKNIAAQNNVTVDFRCRDVIRDGVTGQYDFVYDSGMLHHLPPHRRITYMELLKSVLKPGGYFGLTCFAWGENCADEVDDWEFYKEPFRAGVAFTKEMLTELFSPQFDVLEIRKYKNGVPGTIQGLQFMRVCLFQDKRQA